MPIRTDRMVGRCALILDHLCDVGVTNNDFVSQGPQDEDDLIDQEAGMRNGSARTKGVVMTLAHHMVVRSRGEAMNRTNQGIGKVLAPDQPNAMISQYVRQGLVRSLTRPEFEI